MEELVLFPEKSDAGMRLDLYLSCELEDMTRSRLQRLIGEGAVRVNGRTVSKSCKISEKDEITVSIPAPCEPEILPEDIPLDVVYEDADIILVNKPRGMVVHPAPGHYSGTLVNALMYRCKGELSGINGVMRPGIVHRIDRDTSGILVAAKNDFSHSFLSAQLASHSMTRIYSGIVRGRLKEEEGRIETLIGRSPNDRKKMAVLAQGGRNAVTHWFLKENFAEFALVGFRLETGRTHQIRVHMAYVGHPLLGDPVYGPKKTLDKAGGQMLHAGTLGFIHPRTKKYVEFETEPPDDFMDALKRIRRGRSGV